MELLGVTYFQKLNQLCVNTTVWRGTLDRINNEAIKRLRKKAVFCVCERGHLLLYLIPRRDTKNPTNDYLVNWLFYEHADSTHALFQGKKEKASQNVVKRTMSDAYRLYLHSLAKKS